MNNFIVVLLFAYVEQQVAGMQETVGHGMELYLATVYTTKIYVSPRLSYVPVLYGVFPRTFLREKNFGLYNWNIFLATLRGAEFVQ